MRLPRRTCLVLAAGLIFGSVSKARADAGESGLTNALDLISRAEGTADISRKIPLYEEGLKQCQLIAETSSNSCAAQTLWAMCLVDLSQAVTQRFDSVNYSYQAKVRLAQAEQCDPKSWLVQQIWGQLLLFEAEHQAASPTSAARLLEQARQRFEKSRQAPAFKGDHAAAELYASVCLVRLAELTPDRSKKLSLYAEAGRLCESAAQATGFAKLGQVYTLWGVVLLQTGKLNGSRLTIRQGIEHLQTAIGLSPHDLQTRYNLACAYALLANPKLAIQELRVCLQNDSTGAYRKAAQNDSDLATLRELDEFRSLFSTSPDTLPLSN